MQPTLTAHIRSSMILLIGLSAMLVANPALAQQTTTRSGPYGNSQTTVRTSGNGQQITTRSGPYGNSQTTVRTYSR